MSKPLTGPQRAALALMVRWPEHGGVAAAKHIGTPVARRLVAMGYAERCWPAAKVAGEAIRLWGCDDVRITDAGRKALEEAGQ